MSFKMAISFVKKLKHKVTGPHIPDLCERNGGEVGSNSGSWWSLGRGGGVGGRMGLGKAKGKPGVWRMGSPFVKLNFYFI